MSRQVHQQWRHCDEAFFDRVEIGAYARVLPFAGRPDPENRAAMRVLGFHDRLRLVPEPEPDRLDARQFLERQIRYVDVEDYVR